jgi:hypothetical protein
VNFQRSVWFVGEKKCKHILEIRAMLCIKNAHPTFCLKNEYASLDFVLMKLKNRDILNVRNWNLKNFLINLAIGSEIKTHISK